MCSYSNHHSLTKEIYGKVPEIKGTGALIFKNNKNSSSILLGKETMGPRSGQYNLIGGHLDVSCPVCNMIKEFIEETHINPSQILLKPFQDCNYFIFGKSVIFICDMDVSFDIRSANKVLSKTHLNKSLPMCEREMSEIKLFRLDKQMDNISDYTRAVLNSRYVKNMYLN